MPNSSHYIKISISRTEKNLINFVYTNNSEIRIHLGRYIYTDTHIHTHTHIYTMVLKAWSQTTSIASPENLIEMPVCRSHPRSTELETLETGPRNLCLIIV